ncbi:MAG: PD-(D/E)XK nuclease family protein [SAR324 cluster bacterium]|nr:PD-(D/E)XK nuclease family protein [SAR324 cluster bacterium]
MKILFGTHLDQAVYPDLLDCNKSMALAGHKICGINGFVEELEMRLGLKGSWASQSLRVELYRQRLSAIVAGSFFEQSFQKDELGTTSTLLQWRDDLILRGFDFKERPDCPHRLKTLIQAEHFQDSTIPILPPGFSDRIRMIMNTLINRKDVRTCGITSIELCEPLNSHATPWKQLLTLLESGGIALRVKNTPVPETIDDLGKLRHLLRKVLETGKMNDSPQLDGDGSLVILRTATESLAADAMFNNLSVLSTSHPLLLVPDSNALLPHINREHGFPSAGFSSRSSHRPVLQLLPLSFALLWKPVNVKHLIEFLALPHSPVGKLLSRKLLAAVVRLPGIGGTEWEKCLEGVSREIVRDWFEGDHFDRKAGILRHAVIQRLNMLDAWCFKEMQGFRNTNDIHYLPVLQNQIFQLRTIIETNPRSLWLETDLKQLIALIQESGHSLDDNTRQVGHLPYVHHPQCIMEPVEQLIWWNCTQNFVPVFPRLPWQRTEREYLQTSGTVLPTLEEQGRELLKNLSDPVMKTIKKLILVIPDSIDGQTTSPHPIYDVILSAFNSSEIHKIEFQAMDWINGTQNPRLLMPLKTDTIPMKPLHQPKRWWKLENPQLIQPRKQESPTSIEKFLLYPFKWLFEYHARLKTGLIFQISDAPLPGLLAENITKQLWEEKLLLSDMDDSSFKKCIAEMLENMIPREGLYYALPAKEIERQRFLEQLQQSLCALRDLLKINGWDIETMQKKVMGMFGSTPVSGTIDMILVNQNGDHAIVDLKWSKSMNKFKKAIQENTAWQIMFYARMFDVLKTIPMTYYHFNRSQMLTSFSCFPTDHQGVQIVIPDENLTTAAFWNRMENTWNWRLNLLNQGWVEVNIDQTKDDDTLMVEPSEDVFYQQKNICKYHDYAVLLGFLE